MGMEQHFSMDFVWIESVVENYLVGKISRFFLVNNNGKWDG